MLLSKLETIDLSFNRLMNVPDQCLGEWGTKRAEAEEPFSSFCVFLIVSCISAQSVQNLLLQNNLLWGLSGELGTCAKLVKLDLRNNALVDLPPGLGNLTKLEEVE